MKTLVCTLVATAFFAGFAYAGEMQGTVKSVDQDKHMITMDDGMSVMATKDVMLDHVMKGDKVMIMTDKDNMATSVEKQ